MIQVPDAPYIIEAETKGIPPYGDDFPVSDIADDFAQAKNRISQAVWYLCRAASTAERYGKSTRSIDELIELLDDETPYRMDQVVNWYRKEV